MTTRTPAQALAYLRAHQEHAPAFGVNECKKQTRTAYGVASDGSKDATEAWSRTRHRLSAAEPWLPGALAWWTGGSEGHGHVAICDTKPGYVWTVDYLRPGHWDRVLLAAVSARWTQLREVGFSADIDGVQVVKIPVHRPTRVEQARTRYQRDRVVDLKLLDAAVAAGRTGPVKRARDQVDAAMRALLKEVTR